MFILDFSEGGCLDFHPQLQAQVLREFFIPLFPVPPLVLVVAAPPACRLFMKIMLACLPDDYSENFVDVPQRDNIAKYVGPSDTPAWWYGDNYQSSVLPHCPQDQRLSREDVASERQSFSVTLSKLWNQGPSLDLYSLANINNIDVAESRPLSAAREGETGLGAILDDPGDDW